MGENIKNKANDKVLTSKICEQFMQLNINNKQPNHKMGNLNRYLSKEDI